MVAYLVEEDAIRLIVTGGAVRFFGGRQVADAELIIAKKFRLFAYSGIIAPQRMDDFKQSLPAPPKQSNMF